MTVYISGPITGHLEGNRAAFEAAASRIAKTGATPINPHDIAGKVSADTWESAMRADIAALCGADAIVFLPNWRDSRGAKLERQVAEGLRLTIYESIFDLVDALEGAKCVES